MNDIRELEGPLLLVMGIALAVSTVGRIVWPEYYFWPDWVLTALLVLWIVGFVKWAITGGIPPRVS